MSKSIKELKAKKEFKINLQERKFIKFKDLVGVTIEINAAEWFTNKKGKEVCVLAIGTDKFTFAPTIVSAFFKKVYEDEEYINELETVGINIEPCIRKSKSNNPNCDFYYDFEIV